MGVYDQAARFATRAEPSAVVRRLLEGKGLSLQFRIWQDTRTLPLPGGPERTADLVAALDDATGTQPWLLVLEFQAQVDPDKIEVTLEEVAILRSRSRHGPDRQGKYRVTAGMIYLQGAAPAEVLDMTFPDGSGTRHAPLHWYVAQDDAAQTVEGVAGGQQSWGMLFWVPLMAGGGEEALIARWKEVVAATVTDGRMRGNLAGIALVFAELAGRAPAWKRFLEGWEMTESQVVNEWISQGEAKGELKQGRQSLLRVLKKKFPGLVSEELSQLILQQDSMALLNDWLDAAVAATSIAEFIAVLRQ